MDCIDTFLKIIFIGLGRLFGLPPGVIACAVIESVSWAVFFYLLLGLLGERGKKLQRNLMEILRGGFRLIGKCLAFAWNSLVWVFRALAGSDSKSSK